MIGKEVTGLEEIKYFEKKYKYVLSCDICGKIIYEGEDKLKLQDKLSETYRITTPVYGKMGVEGEEVLHFCGTTCYNNFLSKEFMHIVQIPGVKTRYDGDF